MPNEYIPEHAVVITTVAGFAMLLGVNVRPGAVDPATVWTELVTPTRFSTKLVSGAKATHE